MSSDVLLSTLPVEQRLALAYAPKALHSAFLAFFALDARLASIVREGREPALVQLRMAWWRDQLAKPAGDRPQGEPLLQLISDQPQLTGSLADLIDGWEAMAVGQPGEGGLEALAHARAAGFVASSGSTADAMATSAGREWALADLAARLHDDALRDEALALAAACAWKKVRLSKSFRPLAVLHTLARHNHAGEPLLNGFGAFLRAVRVGLSGT